MSIEDITPTVETIRRRLDDGDEPAASGLLPTERPYPLPAQVATVIGGSVERIG